MNKVIGLFFLIALYSVGTHADDSIPQLKPELDPSIKRLLQKVGVDEQDVSFSLIELGGLKIIEEHRSQEMIPLASVSKMLTINFALEQLGPEFRFSTKTWFKGQITEGRLNGDLYVEGSGDPLFTSPDLANLCFQLRNKGINSLTGKVFLLGNRPTLKSEVSLIGLGDQTYNPSIAGLNLNFNRIELIRTKNTYGPIPPIEHFNFKFSDEKFLPGQDLKFIPIPPNQENWVMSKDAKKRSRLELPIKLPLMHFSAMMKLYCSQEGVNLSNFEITDKLPSGLLLISEQKSIPLEELSRLTLEYSNNLLAESVLARAASDYLQRPSLTLIESGQALNSWLFKTYNLSRTADQPQLEFVNGSGLTTENRASTNFFTQAIAKMENKSYNSRSFKTLLSLGGHNGWIKDSLSSHELTHRVWAKTGSLDYVNNLAGYLHAPNGKKFAFAIFLSDQAKRKILDGIYADHHHLLKKQAPAWKNKSGRIIVELLQHWQEKHGL